MREKISVIIPTLNEEDYLPDLLWDLRAQTLRPHEIIVADSHSIDATVSLAKNFGCTIVHAERSQPDARNAGALEADGDILVFLDADSRLPKKFLHDALLEFHARSLSLACPHFWPKGSGLLVKILHSFSNSSAWLLEDIVPIGPGNCIFVRRDYFKKSGGFPKHSGMSAVEFVRKSRGIGRFGVLSSHVFVSDRRFRKDGAIRSVARHVALSPLLLVGYFHPQKIQKSGFF